MQVENPDSGDWGNCSQYVEATSTDKVTLGALSNKYRVLIVPGIMNSCASAAPAFQEGQVHLRETHGFTVELLAVPNDSSESNAKVIAQYLKDHSQGDARKYIVVGYSKGTPDLQVALATQPDVVSIVAAFISVAGASGGSPIADVLPAQADRWMQRLKVGKWEGD